MRRRGAFSHYWDSNALTLLPVPRILDKVSHFRYLIYYFRFLQFIAGAFRTIQHIVIHSCLNV
jgi:hypothetical protein